MSRNGVTNYLRPLLPENWRVRAGVLVTPDCSRLLPALRSGLEEGWVLPVLIGSKDALAHAVEVLHAAPGSVETIEADGDEAVMQAIVDAVRNGSVDMLVLAPACAPRALARMREMNGDLFPAREKAAGVSLFYTEKLERPILLADVAANAEPDADTREAIVRHGIDAARALGIDTPRVALLAAVEVPSPGLPVTMEAKEVAERFAGESGCHVEGPLSMDLAVSEHAAKKKKATGEVPGHADLLVGPNLTVSRGIHQALTLLCDESAGSVLVGGHVPVALPGRGEGGKGAAASIMFASILAR